MAATRRGATISVTLDAELVMRGVKPRRLTRTEYDQLVAAGVFRADERLELLHGIIVAMTPIGTRHSDAVDELTGIFVGALRGRARVRVQNPYAASDDSEPRPDLSIVPPGRYGQEHPRCALLVIEVADSPIAVDRDVKGPLYAASGVPEYWIVNIEEGVVEVYRDPVRGRYRCARVATAGEILRPEALPEVAVPVAELFA